MDLRHPAHLLLFILSVSCAGPGGDGPEPVAATDSGSASVGDSGPRIIHLQDGGWMAGELQEGLRVGTWSSYFADSTLRSRITYDHGKENGPTLVNHPNGMPYYVGSYTDGRNSGEWVFYDEQGAELKRVQYDSTGTPMMQ